MRWTTPKTPGTLGEPSQTIYILRQGIYGFLLAFLFQLQSVKIPARFSPGANPTIVSYNVTNSLVRFENILFFSTLLKRSSLLQ
jgi:hypothetical protein